MHLYKKKKIHIISTKILFQLKRTTNNNEYNSSNKFCKQSDQKAQKPINKSETKNTLKFKVAFKLLMDIAGNLFRYQLRNKKAFFTF